MHFAKKRGVSIDMAGCFKINSISSFVGGIIATESALSVYCFVDCNCGLYFV